MEKLTTKTPPDVLSFIGHTLGFWPKESLVCITLNENSIGATLRIDPERDNPELTAATRDFDALMRRALNTRSYPDIVAVLLVAEWLYGDWAARAGGPESWPTARKHAEWIRLHNNPEYNRWVAWLRGEFNAVKPADAGIRAHVAATFAEAVRLERAFFDSAMEAG